MKNKSLILILIVLLSINLVSCNNSNGTKKSTDKEVSNNDKIETNQKENDDSPIVIPETELSGIQGKTGPMIVDVTKLIVLKLTPDEDYLIEEYGDKELQLLGLELKVENTIDENFTFEPEFSTITTNTKEQIDSAYLLAEEIGGKYLGNVIQEGFIYFIVNSDIDDIDNIKLHIPKGYGEDLEFVGDDLILDIDITNYK